MEVNDGGICRTFAPEWKPEVHQRVATARKAAGPATPRTGDFLPPDYVFQPGSMKISTHMEDFISCMRSRDLPRCHVDRAFQEAVAILMSVESFRRERKVRWDAAREEIV
jgi:hypothetical protein